MVLAAQGVINMTPIQEWEDAFLNYIRNYERLHGECPVCGDRLFKIIEFSVYEVAPEIGYKDLSKCKCCKCGNVHTVHDRVPVIKVATKQDKLNVFFMTCASAAAKLSLAVRNKVGAVLVRDGRIISTGYNGQPSGFDNCCEITNADGTLTTKSTVIHAEMNAILFCAKTGVSTNNTTMYITLSPCNGCVTSVIQAGITHIYYLEEYRDTSSIDNLRKAGVTVEQMKM